MMEWLLQSITFHDRKILYLDIIALLWFIAAWFGYARYAITHYHTRLNLIRIMDEMRSRWMQQMVRRDNRITDATLIGNLLRSISFFASTTILILLGLFAAFGAREEGIQFIHAIPFTVGATTFMYELKLVVLILIFVYAFFKLTWSMRQYNYACVLVGAAPFITEDHHIHDGYAARAGALISNAGRHFNMGLRAYYFGLATVSWFINGLLFMAITTWVVYIVYRREFRSHTVNNLRTIGSA